MMMNPNTLRFLSWVPFWAGWFFCIAGYAQGNPLDLFLAATHWCLFFDWRAEARETYPIWKRILERDAKDK